jgi:hypothetical protein
MRARARSIFSRTWRSSSSTNCSTSLSSAAILATSATTNGATNAVLTYQVTNNGNGPEVFTLTPNVANSGDDFDPALSQVVLDTNNNGVYDAGCRHNLCRGHQRPAADA